MTPPPVFYDCCKQSVRFADKTDGGVTPPPPFRFEESSDSLEVNLSTAKADLFKADGRKKEVVG